MQIGTLTDPLTGDTTICRIADGSGKITQVYHIPLDFNIVTRVESVKRHPFVVTTEKETILLWATSAEGYAQKFDRFNARYLDTLDYLEHLDKIMEKQDANK